MADSPSLSQSSGPFDRLPLEILIQIVEPLLHTSEQPFSYGNTTLKNLRLTHRRFASLRDINEVLFETVVLSATKRGLKSLQSGDLSLIATCAKTLLFETPPAWTVSFEGFNDMTDNPTLGGRYKELAAERADLSRDEMYWLMSREEKRGRWNFTHSERRAGFNRYMRNAKYNKNLLDGSNPQLKQAWLEMFGMLGDRVLNVCFVSTACLDMLSEDFDCGLCELGGHSHVGEANFYRCRRAVAIAADALFTMVMSCIAISGFKPRVLNLYFEMTGDLDWETIPEWEKLDLSRLGVLKMRPQFPTADPSSLPNDIRDAFPVPSEDQLSKVACKNLNLLLDKSHGALRHLRIESSESDRDFKMSWPDRPAPYDLPWLQTFHCNPGRVNSVHLATWLKRMPRLENVYLTRGLTPDLEVVDWLDTFDALRDHRNAVRENAPGIEVFLDYIMVGGWDMLRWKGTLRRKHREIKARPRWRGTEFDEHHDGPRAIRSYLVYAEPYETNLALRYFLQDD